MDLINKIQNKLGLDEQDPNGAKCCFCFPLKCGIIMMGFIAFIDLITELVRISLIIDYSVFLGILYIPALLFILTGCLIFIKYCYRDNELNRKHLVVACSLMVFTNVLILIIWIFGGIFDKDIDGSTVF